MLKGSSLLIWLSSKIVRVIEKSSKCSTRATSENLVQHTYLLPRFLHDFDARLIHVLHVQRHLDKPLSLKTPIVPAARHQQPHRVRLPNQNRNRTLKTLRPTSSRLHIPQSPNGWKTSNGSILKPNSTFLLGMSVFCRSDHSSALERMEIHLGKAQLVKAIDDGGVSMYFRRDPTSSQLSRRVILSVEVAPSQRMFLINPGQTEKARKGKWWGDCQSPCRSIIRWNAWSSLSFRILWNGQRISRGISCNRSY